MNIENKELDEAAKEYTQNIPLGHLNIQTHYDAYAIKGEIMEAYKAGANRRQEQSANDAMEFAYIQGRLDERAKKTIWYLVSEKMPENIGNYLCITNDDKIMVCYVPANGWWTRVPDGQYYGDMGEKVTVDSKRVDREVVKWTYLPEYSE